MIYHILLKPDIFLRGLVEDTFQMLEDLHIDILGFALIRPNSQLLNCMYLKDFKWEYDYFEHNLELYRLGPSLSLVCDIEHEVLKNIRTIKGSALPTNIDKSSLRGRLKVRDRCINSIHMADSIQNSNQELRCIFHCTDFGKSVKNMINYPKLKELVLDLCLENYASTTKEVYAEMVLNNLLLRINNFINSVIALTGEAQFSQLIELTKSAKLIYGQPDMAYKIRFFEFFWKILDINMIYYSDFEKYYIQSDLLYSKINHSSDMIEKW